MKKLKNTTEIGNMLSKIDGKLYPTQEEAFKYIDDLHDTIRNYECTLENVLYNVQEVLK